MKKKLRKLTKDPNRFFFDYFAKRVRAKSQLNVIGLNAASKASKSQGDFLLPPNYTFEPKVHPWVQVAKKFGLRSGALTGHPDQSMLVNSADLLDVLSYIFWVAHGAGTKVRLYTLDGHIDLDITRSSLLSIRRIEEVYALICSTSDFVVEFIGEFDNNFAASFFVYDSTGENTCVVRSNQAYVKRFVASRIHNIYPAIIDQFGDWAFGTPWPVDIVYTWVDCSDPDWIDMWNKEFPNRPFDTDRFSSKDELRYSLRALCKYLPWFNKIYVVSNCNRPSWLKDHPRINWVSHEDIFPNPADLPTFNSHAIEACLHRIPEINERFIYFNDDVFVAQPCYYSNFYDQSGRSISQLEPYGMVAADNLFDATREFLAPAMKCRARLLENYPWYQATQLHKHTPHVLLKSVLEAIEIEFKNDMDHTRSHRLRSPEDLNVTSFLYHHYALANGTAVEGDAPSLIVRPQNIHDLLGKGARKYNYLCFNDGDGSAMDSGYVRGFFEFMAINLPSKSSFEIDFAS